MALAPTLPFQVPTLLPSSVPTFQPTPSPTPVICMSYKVFYHSLWCSTSFIWPTLFYSLISTASNRFTSTVAASDASTHLASNAGEIRLWSIDGHSWTMVLSVLGASSIFAFVYFAFRPYHTILLSVLFEIAWVDWVLSCSYLLDYLESNTDSQ